MNMVIRVIGWLAGSALVLASAFAVGFSAGQRSVKLPPQSAYDEITDLRAEVYELRATTRPALAREMAPRD